MAEGTLGIVISNQSIHVTSVTVTASNYFITTLGGTLQMTATVLPANATDPLVTWSVITGSGTASVSTSGLVTALTNGYITVQATARDGSGITGSHIVDISGQVPPPPTSGLRDRDGNMYNSVSIGTQEWIVENLRTTHYADGTAIPNLTDCSNPYGALYNWYAASKGNEQNYGALYNWYAAIDARLIANTDWHVSTVADIDALITYAGGSAVAGGKLKETGTTYWQINIGATNEYGFNLRGSGQRDKTTGAFTGITAGLLLWGVYPPAPQVWQNYIVNGFTTFMNASYSTGTVHQKLGCSIRLVKDSTTLSHGDIGTYVGNDEKIYNTICIGTQEWMSENLNETKYRTGEDITIVTDNTAWAALSTEAMCWYNNSRQDIAPTGWHVPTKTECETLVTELGGIGVAGGKMKETGTIYWNAPNTGATNYSMFSSRGSGRRLYNTGAFIAIRASFNMWSITEGTGVNAGFYYELENQSFSDDTSSAWRSPKYGHSIRLIKDDSTDPGTVSDVDGNSYTTVKIGTQVWMAENLKVTHYNDGSDISIVTDDAAWAALVTGAMCYYPGSAGIGWSSDTGGAYVWYDNLIANIDHGALYNWFAINNAAGLAYLTRNGVRETGWRVPLVADFNLLKSDIITVDSTEVSVDDSDVSVDDAGINLGVGLKETGTAHWTSGNGTDLYGFKAIGVGIRDFATCIFSGFKLINRLWSSEADDASNSFSFLIDDAAEDASVEAQENGNGYSVRLVRDLVNEEPDPPDPPTPPTYPDVVPYTYGAIPEYRFYISTASSVTYEVFPLKFLSSALVYELEGDQVFYRRKFNGSLLFGTNSLVVDSSGVTQNRKDDWLLFWAIEQTDPSEKLYLTITKDFGGVIDVYWDGYFATSEGKFDIDICTFEVTPIAIDDYTEVLELADVQYNFLSTTDGVAAMGTVSATYDGDTYNYTRTRWLARIGSDNVLSFIADQMLGATVVSDFFTNAVNPITLAANRLLYLTIAQKSDITRYLSTDPASTAMLSWNELMDILWGMFQVRWTYDLLTNTFTVEHNSLFTHPGGIDLRQQLSCVATNKYQYLKEKMPKYETFSMMEGDGVNFVGTPIYYDSAGVNQDPSSNTTEFTIPVVTDLEYLLKGGGTGSDEGFVILCPEFNGATYNVRGEFGRFDNSFYALNMDLSIANLQHDYFRHDRVLPTGYLNGQYVTFYTTRKTKQQECSAILCEEIDPTGEITTELGETYFGGAKAIIKTASLSPSGEMKFILLYGPIPAVNPGIPDLFGVSAVPSLTSTNVPDDTVTIEFTFTAPCPGDFTVRIREYVIDNTGAIHDMGAWETVIFLTGTNSYSFTPVYTHQIAAGWSVKLEFEYTGSEIDLFRGKDDPLPVFMTTWMPPYVYTIL